MNGLTCDIHLDLQLNMAYWILWLLVKQATSSATEFPTVINSMNKFIKVGCHIPLKQSDLFDNVTVLTDKLTVI